MSILSNSTALVFPGQGSQAVGMGRELAANYPLARRTFEEADAILGFSISAIAWEGPESELNDTLNTQPALFVHSIAAQRVLQDLHPGFRAAALAGHSLGELSALVAGGALDFEAGLRLVRVRGELMKRAGELAPGGMAAVLGLEIPVLEAVCAQASTPGEIVQVANDNCPGQVVISGAKAAVERAVAAAKAAGAKRALPLAVSIAAHSPLMASIQGEWDAAVAATAFSPLKIPLVGNVHAKPLVDEAAARADIRAQMQSRVRWTESIRYLDEQGIHEFFEVGTGTVLAGLIKRIASGLNVRPLGMPLDFSALDG